MTLPGGSAGVIVEGTVVAYTCWTACACMHGIYSYYYNVLYSVCSIPLIVEDLMAVTIVEEFDAAYKN